MKTFQREELRGHANGQVIFMGGIDQNSDTDNPEELTSEVKIFWPLNGYIT